MKILFFGDSITDAGRAKQNQGNLRCPSALGTGYVQEIAGELVYTNPNKYEIINTGLSGHRVVDLYARIKTDCWNYAPDVLSILIGVNDVWHELYHQNGVELDRFERVYRTIIEETKRKFPDIKIVIMEPFVQMGAATQEKYEEFKDVYNYAKVAKKLADEFKLPFVQLQKPLDDYAEKFGIDKVLLDGVHPAVAGAKVIAKEWLKVFDGQVEKISE